MRLHVIRYCEILVAGVNFRAVGERVDRLEADAEPANREFVLCALGDATYATHVGLIERPAEVGARQASRGQLERDLARPDRVATPTQRVFGVLKQFEDEVRPVVVAIGQQHRADPTDVGAVAPPVLVADRLVVGCHPLPPRRSGNFSDAKFAQVCSTAKSYAKIRH